MPCCRQSSMAIVHTMFIFANSKSKKYATTQLFKSLETHLLWIFPYSLEVEINNGFWSENSKNHLRERFPKDRCSNLQSFLLFIQSTLDLPNGIFAWWNGKCINDFTLTSTKKKKKMICAHKPTAPISLCGTDVYHWASGTWAHCTTACTFHGLSERTSESYTLSVQHLSDLEGNSRMNGFLSATGVKDFGESLGLQTCLLPFFGCVKELSWSSPDPGRKFPPLQLSWGQTKPFIQCLPRSQVWPSLGEGRWHTISESQSNFLISSYALLWKDP